MYLKQNQEKLPKDMPDKISDLPVFGGTIYSPELFSDPNKNVESDETTLCDNISNTDVQKCFHVHFQ
jgi:hypothetical protein